MMERPEIPDLFIEMLAAGELSARKRAELVAKYGTAEVEKRVAEIRTSDTAILDRYQPAQMARNIRSRVRTEQAIASAKNVETPDHGWVAGHVRRYAVHGFAVRVSAITAALALVVLIGVYLMTMAGHMGGGETGIRAKGYHPALLIYRQESGGVDLLQEGDIVKPRDKLQISYVSAGSRFGVILSIDGRGTITVHLPESASKAAPLEAEGQTPLKYAYQLDDAPDFERFFFVVSNKSFPVAEAVRSARALVASKKARTASLSLPAGIEQTSFLLRKAGD